MNLLDGAGFSSVVATNCEQEYDRMLHIGDHLRTRNVIDSISEEKHTGLGIGHFVTTRVEYETLDGEPVGRQLFRILKFKPGTGTGQAAAAAPDDGGGRQAAPEAPASGAHARQPVVVRRGEGAPAADPAVLAVPGAAPPAPPALRQVRLVRVGHARGERPRHRLQLRGRRTTRRCRRSTTRCRSGSSSSRRGRASSPTSSTSTRPT